MIYAELVKVIDDSNAVYRADEAFPYCAFFRKEVNGEFLETPEAAFETLEEAERWIRRTATVALGLILALHIAATGANGPPSENFKGHHLPAPVERGSWATPTRYEHSAIGSTAINLYC